MEKQNGENRRETAPAPVRGWNSHWTKPVTQIVSSHNAPFDSRCRVPSHSELWSTSKFQTAELRCRILCGFHFPCVPRLAIGRRLPNSVVIDGCRMAQQCGKDQYEHHDEQPRDGGAKPPGRIDFEFRGGHDKLVPASDDQSMSPVEQVGESACPDFIRSKRKVMSSTKSSLLRLRRI